ncbi:hypothetical protein J3B02_000579 [Coemansia erecta]|nr:hypothetical protein J3B02_000579 [Coemansia erecta]
MKPSTLKTPVTAATDTTVIDALSPALAATTSSVSSGSPATAYILGHHSPLAGGSSSPESMSSVMGSVECLGLTGSCAPLGSSPFVNNAAYCLNADGLATKEWLVASTQGLMFPSLPVHATANDVTGDSETAFAAAAASALQLSNTSATADAAAIDGWLQQYVNAEALDQISNLSNSINTGAFDRASPPTGSFTFGATCPGSILAVDASPEFSYASPEYSPPNNTIDFIDQSTVAAIAAAMSEPLSSGMLASVFSSSSSSSSSSSAATVDIRQALADAVGNSELLPLTGLATPMANIAPQKTLSSVASSSPPMLLLDTAMSAVEAHPPVKRQKRPADGAANRKAVANGENDKNIASGSLGLGSNHTGKSTLATATIAASASNSNTRLVMSGNASNGNRPLAPSPPRSSNAAGSAGSNAGVSRNNMVPLAPRQPSSQAQKRQSVGVKQVNGSQVASRSGSNTPPGLSVLAKIAQKQVPIQVKLEDPTSSNGTTATMQRLRPIAQAKVANVVSSTDSPRQSSPEETTVDTAAQKRQERLIKNRAAALLSRKRKREYMSKLEVDVEELRESNSSLVKRLEEMEKRLGEITRERDQLLRGKQSVTISGSATNSVSSSSSSSSSSLQQQQSNGGASNDSNSDGGNDTNKGSPSPEKQEEQKQQDSESMEIDECNETSDDKQSSGIPCIRVPFTSSSALISDTSSNSTKDTDTCAEKMERTDANAQSHPVSPRVSLPEDASNTKRHPTISSQPNSTGKKKQQQQQQQQQRTAGALLMAMLFSFSLFTLPSLYTSDNQISTGGTQSAGILPIRSLPATEPRLLISDSSVAKNDVVLDDSVNTSGEAPLIERVRRSITALTQQIDGSQKMVDAAAAAVGNHSQDTMAKNSGGSSNRMRPMTMKESMGLRNWINTGLAVSKEQDFVRHQISGQEPEHSETGVSAMSSVSLVRRDSRNDDSIEGASSSSSSSSSAAVNRVTRPLDYAMLYCPTMQHVLFGGDMLDIADMPRAVSSDHLDIAHGSNKVARVIHADKYSNDARALNSALVSSNGNNMDNIDDRVSQSVDDKVASLDLLVPTQAGNHLVRNSRPKMSFYSPVAMDRENSDIAGGGILAPWEEYARMADNEEQISQRDQYASGSGSTRQKYLRIDVEVVGSRWVTADKFAQGLY